MSSKVERLLNLTVALLDARRPMTLAEIRAKVGGYSHSEGESARRMFERDKDDLRKLGVPVETVAVGNEWGYIVDRSDYVLPPIDLSAEEVTALAVALRIAGDESTRLGFTKVAARAPDPRDAPDPRTRVTLEVAALDDLADPLVQRRAVRFGYRTASGDEARRTVDPYGVVQRRGAWYLVGRDHDRDALRAFRIDRMTDAPQPHGDAGAFDIPDDLDIAGLVAGPASEGTDIEVAAAPAVAWEVARHGGEVRGEDDAGRSVIRFAGADPERLLPSLVGFGADVEVLAPPAIRERVIAALRELSA